MRTGLIALALAASACADEFSDSVSDAQKAYQRAIESGYTLLLDGKYEEWRALLQEAVPEDKRTAGSNYVLGTYLFQMDRENSFKAYEAAWKEVPEHTFIAQQYAVGLHRLKRYAEAEKIYANLVDDPNVGVSAMGLRADCLLRAGNFADAAAVWAAADPSSRHSELEGSASWIYGDINPEVRRCRLLAELARGGNATWEELILLDVNWTTDWWTVQVRDHYVKHDLELAAANLKVDSVRYKQLELLGNDPAARDNTVSPHVGIDMNQAGIMLKNDAERLGLLGDQPKLAEHSRAAVRFLQLFRKFKIQTAQQQLDMFEWELLGRHNTTAGDLECADELAELYAEVTSPKLAVLYVEGWTKYADWRFLAGHLTSKRDSLKSADPQLVEGLNKFPDNTALARLALDAARREGTGITEALARCVQVEYTHMSDHGAVTKGFAELAKAAGK